MNKNLLDALENCLQRLQQGESLETVLMPYPRLAEQLRPLLETASLARTAGQESLPLTALARQRARGLALAADLRRNGNRRPFFHTVWRPALTVLVVIAILAMSSNGLLTASAHSLPGDTLYPLKRSVETTQLNLASDPAKRQVLEREFDERRVEEAKSLITDQRLESVEFTGIVSSQLENKWLVSGISVVITSQTKLDPEILVGDKIEVHGATNALGGVDASMLSRVIKPAIQETHPVVSPSPTPQLDPTGQSDLQDAPTQPSVNQGISGESELHETPTGSSVNPARSGERESRPSNGNDQSSESNDGNHSSD
jgi:hypothetical protein